MWYADGVVQTTLTVRQLPVATHQHSTSTTGTVYEPGRGRRADLSRLGTQGVSPPGTIPLEFRKRSGRGLIQFSWSPARVTNFEGEE